MIPERPDWHQHAACRGEGPDAFYPSATHVTTVSSRVREGHRNPISRAAAPAKRVCAGCPVRSECLEHALTRPEVDGVWGGLDEFERSILRRGAAS